MSMKNKKEERLYEIPIKSFTGKSSDIGQNIEFFEVVGESTDRPYGRYIRNFDTLNTMEQDFLIKSHVSIIGLGGLGGGVCEMLARTGLGNLTLIDGDSFETSNLNRQILSTEALIGKSKAMAAANRVHAINSSIVVNHVMEYANDSNLYDLIKKSDLAVDCLDTIDSRFVLQRAAKKAGIPIVSGAIAGVSGQVTVFFPEDRGYELIYGDKGQARSQGVETKTGNLSYCAMLVASLQTSECIKILLGRGDILRNKIMIIDLWTNTFETMALT